MHNKKSSKTRSKTKQDENDIKKGSQSIEELTEKARIVHNQRKQMIERTHKGEMISQGICGKGCCCSDNETTKALKQKVNHNNEVKAQNNDHLYQITNCSSIPQNQIIIIHPEMTSLQTSFRPFQSNRTLEPYLINIKEEYVCGSGEGSGNIPLGSINQHHVSNSMQVHCNQCIAKLPMKNSVNPGSQNQIQSKSNSESIQLSSSRQVSQEMLLHNSVTSKFLESPTLSLGLVQSKITKKQVDSENNSKILNKRSLKSNNIQSSQQILFVPNTQEQIYTKQSLRFYQELIKTYQSQHNNEKQRHFNQNQPFIKKVQIKDVSQQFPQHSKILEPIKENLKIQQNSKTMHQSPSIHPQLNSSIMTSYQMQVEYLRKINLYQSFQIQKLRKLIRAQKIQNQSLKAGPFMKNHYKKAIDIIKPRQTFYCTQQSPQRLNKQISLHTNPTKSLLNNTNSQLLNRNSQNLYINNEKRPVSFSTNHQKASDTFYSNKNDLPTKNKQYRHLKTKRKPSSISIKNNTSQNCEGWTKPLDCKSQSFTMSTQQMIKLEGANHNMSCSTYFMGTKSNKKKNISMKSKTSHSQRNLSTIVSSSNKQNLCPKQPTNDCQSKKITKNGSIFNNKNMEMHINAKKKHSQQLKSLSKQLKTD